MAATLVLIYILAMSGFCIAEDQAEKCPITEKDIEISVECAEEIKPGFSKESAMTDPDYMAIDEWTALCVCYAKKVGYLSDSGEYNEEKLLQHIENYEVSDDVKAELTEAAKQCAKDEKEGEAIVICEMLKGMEICSA